MLSHMVGDWAKNDKKKQIRPTVYFHSKYAPEINNETRENMHFTISTTLLAIRQLILVQNKLEFYIDTQKCVLGSKII